MSDEKVYSEEEILEKLNKLPGWELRDGWIRRSFKTPGWPHTLMLVNAIGYRAEAGFHHPDLEIGWVLFPDTLNAVIARRSPQKRVPNQAPRFP